MSWHVLDENGCVKATTHGSGLSDPVLVTQGGTSRTTWPQGSLITSDLNDSLAPLPKDTDGFKVLSFLSSDQVGRYRATGDLIQASVPAVAAFTTGNRRWTILEVTAENAVPQQNGFFTVVNSGTQTAVVDSTSTWRRYTTGAADVINGAGVGATGVLRAAWSPRMKAKFRTGASITNYRFFFGIFDTAPSGNTDDFSARTGVAIRYSDVAGDTGFVTWSGNGTTQTIGSSNIAAIAASTVYTVELQVVIPASGSPVVILTVNGVSQTITLPPNIFLFSTSPNMSWTLSARSADSGNAKAIDITALLVQTQAPIVPASAAPIIRWTGPSSGQQNMLTNPILVLPAASDVADGNYTLTCDTDMSVTVHGFSGGGAAQDESNNATGRAGGGGAAGDEAGESVALKSSKTYSARVGGGGESHIGSPVRASTAGGDTFFKTADGVTTYLYLGGGQPAVGAVAGAGGAATTGAHAVAGGNGGAGNAGAGSNGSNSAGGAGGGGGGGGTTGPGAGGSGGTSNDGAGGSGGAAGSSGTGDSGVYGNGGEGHSGGGGGGGGGRGGKITGVSGNYGGGGGGTGGLQVSPFNNSGGNGQTGVLVIKFVSQ